MSMLHFPVKLGVASCARRGRGGQEEHGTGGQEDVLHVLRDYHGPDGRLRPSRTVAARAAELCYCRTIFTSSMAASTRLAPAASAASTRIRIV